jgi:cell fate (sporulation/competence/biofilm development) regulator YmcA (YheA/YmcA/DUF963 family)
MFGSGKTYFGKNLMKESKNHLKEIEEKVQNDPLMYGIDFSKEFLCLIEKNDYEEKFMDFNHFCIDFKKSSEELSDAIKNSEKKIFYLNIDELSGDEDQIRKLWTLLDYFQKQNIKEKYFIYYLSGKQTLMNKVGFLSIIY